MKSVVYHRIVGVEMDLEIIGSNLPKQVPERMGRIENYP